jgi:hypothetical protein
MNRTAVAQVRGQDVRVGDDLWFLSSVHRVTRVEDYRHPVVTGGDLWHIAKSDGPAGFGRAAWGMTLATERGYAAGYTIGTRPFGCKHCCQPIHRIGDREGDPDDDPWQETTGWIHDKGGVFCAGTQVRAERGADLASHAVIEDYPGDDDGYKTAVEQDELDRG